MRTPGFLLGLAVSTAVSAQTMRQIQTIKANGARAELQIFQSSDNTTVEFAALNSDPQDYQLEVSTELENMESSVALPVRQVLRGSMVTATKLFTLRRVDPAKGFFFRKVSWSLRPAAAGGQSAPPRPVQHNGVYNLMWKRGKSFRIDNGFNGYGAHQGDWAFALDFKMPEGTEICAAREGQVISVQSGFSQGGNDPALGDKANYVQIQHSDGSIGRYLHLRRDGVTVKVGDSVQRGQVIGYSGNTGWSTDPHLHFDVIVPKGEQGFRTVAFQLRTGKQARIRPVTGMSLTQDQ